MIYYSPYTSVEWILKDWEMIQNVYYKHTKFPWTEAKRYLAFAQCSAEEVMSLRRPSCKYLGTPS